jgi:hypothetical protein
MMVALAMPVICWIWWMLTPAATASRTTSSRLATASAQRLSSSSAAEADDRAICGTLPGSFLLSPAHRFFGVSLLGSSR